MKGHKPSEAELMVNIGFKLYASVLAELIRKNESTAYKLLANIVVETTV